MYGYHAKSKVVLYTKYIDEHAYSFLTSDSHLNEFGLYDPDEERAALWINLQGYTGRYVEVYLDFIDSFSTLNRNQQILDCAFPDIIKGKFKYKKYKNQKRSYNKSQYFNIVINLNWIAL